MAKPIPTTGQTDWGAPLNAHLAQLNEASTGGVNFAAEPPTGLTSADEGYTYVNTTTREIQRWSGSEFEVLMGGVAVGRERLEQNRDYYVNVDTGDDSNDGLSAGSAFQTIQRAVDIIDNKIDPNGSGITIRLADSPNAYDGVSFDGTRNVTLRGNTNNPSAVRIYTNKNNGVVSSGVRITNEARVNLRGVTLLPGPTSLQIVRAIDIAFDGRCNLSKVVFEDIKTGRTEAEHVYIIYGGFIDFQDEYTINGSADFHIFLSGQSQVRYFNPGSTVNVTVNNNPNFGGSFINCNTLSSCNVEPTVFSGSATGKRFIANVHSTIATNGQGPDFFPGDVPGTVENLSLYL